MSDPAGALPDLLLPRFRLREAALWATAGLAVLAVHAAALNLARQWPSADASAEQAATAIMIDLAPMAVAPEAVPSDIAELVDSMDVQSALAPAEPTEPETAPGETLSPEAVDETTPPEAGEMALAEPPQSESLKNVTPEKLDPVEAETVQPAPLQQSIAEEIVPDLVEAPLPEVAIALPTPRPEPPKPEPEPRPVAKEAAPKPVEKKQVAAPPARKVKEGKPARPSVAARASASDVPKAAAPRPAKEAKAPGESPARWQSRVNAHLNRFKRYPAGERDTGQVAVRFSIDPSGRVLGAALARSSGNAALDQAAIEMVQRASPVPAPPAAIARDRMSLTVPVRFSRR